MSLLIEESTTESVPATLHNIALYITKQSNSFDTLQKDLFFITLLILFEENGFHILEEDREIESLQTYIAESAQKKWKSDNGVYSTVLVLEGYKALTLRLLMSSLGTAVAVNVLINEFDETYSVCLPLSRYVVSPQASTIPMIFRDLKQLSTTFKNKILTPVKSRILNYFGFPSASLIGLPDEILIKILCELPIIDIINVSQLCTRTAEICNNDILWHQLCQRDHKVSQLASDNWKNLYKEMYKAEKNKSVQPHRHIAGSMHEFMDYADYVSYIDNSMWDIM